MTYQDTKAQINGFRAQISSIREQKRAAQAAIEPQPVQNYVFATADGPRALAALFGELPDLFVIHNMGVSCPACTMWADGFNGLYPHIADRAAFVVTSPDPPTAQQRFAAERGWRFPMVSHAGNNFAEDMGYRSESGGWKPGVSVFRRDNDRIVRVADTAFGPGDDFCAVWPLLGLLPDGPSGWRPRFRYD